MQKCTVEFFDTKSPISQQQHKRKQSEKEKLNKVIKIVKAFRYKNDLKEVAAIRLHDNIIQC